MTRPSLADCIQNGLTKSSAKPRCGTRISVPEHGDNGVASFPSAPSNVDETRVGFKGGTNLAIKVPSNQWEETVAFYRDALGMTAEIVKEGALVAFEFGSMTLWLDRTEKMAQAEIWLEVATEDAGEAERHLNGLGINRCSFPGKIGPDFDGFWVTSPTGNVHLVYGD